jgi:hypothetical protein
MTEQEKLIRMSDQIFSATETKFWIANIRKMILCSNRNKIKFDRRATEYIFHFAQEENQFRKKLSNFFREVRDRLWTIKEEFLIIVGPEEVDILWRAGMSFVRF